MAGEIEVGRESETSFEGHASCSDGRRRLPAAKDDRKPVFPPAA